MNDFSQHRLDETRHTAIFQHLCQVLFAGLTSADAPKAIIVAGQPGAGKSVYVARLDAENTFVLDVDALRAFHPAHDDLRRDHPMHMAEATNHDAKRWATNLLLEAAARKLNVIAEATLQNADSVLATVKGFADAGYQVELHVLAVSAEESRVGIAARYQASPVRWTGMEFHDLVYAALPHGVERLANSGLLSRVMIVGRDGKQNAPEAARFHFIAE